MPNTYAMSAGKRITGTVEEVPVSSAPWDGAARQWRVTLRCEGRRMTLDYYGGALAECTIGDVVETLELDNPQGSSFEDWAAEFGYDPDSRRVERTFRTVVQQAKRFDRLRGLA